MMALLRSEVLLLLLLLSWVGGLTIQTLNLKHINLIKKQQSKGGRRRDDRRLSLVADRP